MPVKSRLLRKPSGRLCVRLPKFVITALRQIVESSNAEERENLPWTVSQLLEAWLLRVLTKDELRAVARKSPAFRREAQAWMRWVVRNVQK